MSACARSPYLLIALCCLLSFALPPPGCGRRRAVRSSPPRGFTATSAGGDDQIIDKNHDRNALSQSAKGGRSSRRSEGSHRCAAAAHRCGPPPPPPVDRRDTSAARILASGPASRRMLAGVGRPYRSFASRSSNDDEQRRRRADADAGADAVEDRGQCLWERDVGGLRDVLDRSRYRHPALRERIFGLATAPPEDGGNDGDRQRSSTVGLREGDYPMGPSYVRPLVAGQGMDMARLIDDCNSGDGSTSRVSSTGTKDDDGDDGWLGSLRCLTALFLLASCVPKCLFVEHVVGGDETLTLMSRLGVVFVYDDTDDGSEWVVPLVHLFPLEIPPIRATSPSGLGCRHADDDSVNVGKNIVLMTDLHPNVLGATSLDRFRDDSDNAAKSEEEGGEEGAVMYIGPDSLALIHHLHASMSNFVERSPSDVLSSFGRILDLCTGSGVQALAAISMLESLEGAILADADPIAVAVDVNERALRFTTFNAHLNGCNDKIVTVHADLLSGRKCANCDSLIEALLNELAKSEKHDHHSQQKLHKDDQKFDFILANPPFIPVPPSRSDYSASSLRGQGGDGDGGNTPRYGLFSSGGATGEDCLRAIVRMAPSLLRSDGGLLAVVSEFMNPPSTSSKFSRVKDGEDMHDKMEIWWGSELAATGILFTNEKAIDSDLYAQRRAMRNDLEDIDVWKNHLSLHGIDSISPGLLFIQLIDAASFPGEGRQRLALKHHFVPKTNRGSIWTPHNFDAVKFTRDTLASD